MALSHLHLFIFPLNFPDFSLTKIVAYCRITIACVYFVQPDGLDLLNLIDAAKGSMGRTEI